MIENGDGKLSIDEVMEHGKSKGQPAPPQEFVS